MRIPGIKHLDAVKAFHKLGYTIRRQSKHIILSNGTQILSVPRNNPIKPATMGSIVKAAGLTEQQFRDLL
jgi:hypothetical protein